MRRNAAREKRAGKTMPLDVDLQQPAEARADEDGAGIM